MLPTMIPQIYFYDNARKCFKITYYEKNNMQYAYYSYNTLVASTHQDGGWNTYTRYYIDPDSDKYSNTTAKHIKEMLGLDKFILNVIFQTLLPVIDKRYFICCKNFISWSRSKKYRIKCS